MQGACLSMFSGFSLRGTKNLLRKDMKVFLLSDAQHQPFTCLLCAVVWPSWGLHHLVIIGVSAGPLTLAREAWWTEKP